MNCKDCIHNEVCYRREVCNDIEEQIIKLGCMDFIARADVVEVRRGKWIENSCYNICSVCEKYVHAWNDDGNLQEFAYCPHCGAKMDGGTNDEM